MRAGNFWARRLVLQDAIRWSDFKGGAQAAFFTRPARMQAVQTRRCFLVPPTTAFMRRRLGFHRLRRVLLAWLITLP